MNGRPSDGPIGKAVGILDHVDQIIMPDIICITSSEHFHQVLSRCKLNLVLFMTQHCFWCKELHPLLRRIASSDDFEELQICSVDCTTEFAGVNELFKLAEHDGRSFPLIAAFRFGKLFGKLRGFHPWRNLKDWTADCVYACKITDEEESGLAAPHDLAASRIDEILVQESLFTAICDWKQLDEYCTSNANGVIIGFYLRSRAVYSEALLLTMKQLLPLDEFKDVRFVAFNCDGNDNEVCTNHWWLKFQPRCGFFLNGAGFCFFKYAADRNVALKGWLNNCLAANKICNSAASICPDDVSRSHKDATTKDGADEENATEDTASQKDDDSDSEAESDQSRQIHEVMSMADLHQLTSQHDKVVINFEDEWDPHSTAMAFIFREIGSSASFHEVQFCVVDDLDSDVAQNMQITNCPACIVIHRGTEVARINRAVSRSDLEAWLTESLEALDNASGNDIVNDGVVDPAAIPRSTSTLESGIVKQSPSFSPQVGITTTITERQTLTNSSPPTTDTGTRDTSTRETAIATERNIVPSILTSHGHDDASLLSKMSSLFHKDNISRSSLTSSATAGTTASMHPCEGNYRDKPRPTLHWLRRRNPFSDPEPGCVYVPTPDGEGLQIGRANDAQSYFNLTLSRIEQEDEKNHLVFGIGFVPDPTKKARFESAVFKVEFGYDDSDGKRHQIKIKDISPKEKRGDYSEVHFGRGSEGSVQVTLGNSAASLVGGGRLTTNAEYTRKTASRVRGQGVHTSIAEWTYQEDEGAAGRHGLETQYSMSVILPAAATIGVIWMEFWSKAVLIQNRRRITLWLGTEEDPYRRNLDLSNGTSTAV